MTFVNNSKLCYNTTNYNHVIKNVKNLQLAIIPHHILILINAIVKTKMVIGKWLVLELLFYISKLKWLLLLHD